MEKSLNEVLMELGYRTDKGPFPDTKNIIDQSGTVVFFGDSQQVWDWLRFTSQLPV